MTWVFILSLACVTFFNRYLFLEPNTKINLPLFVMRMLKYAAPCLMISICIPLIFFEADQFKGLIYNNYLYGAIFTLCISLYTRRLLLSIMLSLVFFYVLDTFVAF